jgi:hypothetical protein
MKNNILFKTNLLVSVILLVGFALIATLSYRANYNASLVKIKQVSSLASEGIYYRLSTLLTKPVNISQTMAHDSLLIKLLEEEGSRYQEAAYQETIRKYLDTYKNKYAYDSVFLVSASTNNYYNFNGLDRNLVRGEDENVRFIPFPHRPYNRSCFCPLSDTKPYLLLHTARQSSCHAAALKRSLH